MKLFHGFNFNSDAVVHKKVQSEPAADTLAFVLHGDLSLTLDAKAFAF